MTNIYKKIKKELTSKEKFHIKLGTERIKKVLAYLGNPQDNFKSIHVAGTNGKGSTCAILAKTLETSGYKTGLFTSPHLIKYNERIRISSTEISDEQFDEILKKVNKATKELDEYLTEFEIITICAFLHFSEEKIDIAIIEVGLGGRLDATNVINPILSIITSISLDHTQRLGNTIEKIAFEKAGIIKENSTIISSSKNSGIEIIKKVAKEKSSALILADNVQKVEIEDKLNKITINDNQYKLSLLGDFQGENLALALKAIEKLKDLGFSIKNTDLALKNVHWQARMQFLETNVLMDGAHNPEAAKNLRKFIDKYYSTTKTTWFFGGLNTKSHKEITDILFKENDKIYLIEFDHPSSLKKQDFKEQLTKNKAKLIKINDFIENYNKEKNKNALVIITGSLYLSGDILALEDNKRLPDW